MPPDPIPPADVAAAGGLTGSIFDMIRITTSMSVYLSELAREEANHLQVKQQLFQYNRFIEENPGDIFLIIPHSLVNGPSFWLHRLVHSDSKTLLPSCRDSPPRLDRIPAVVT